MRVARCLRSTALQIRRQHHHSISAGHYDAGTGVTSYTGKPFGCVEPSGLQSNVARRCGASYSTRRSCRSPIRRMTDLVTKFDGEIFQMRGGNGAQPSGLEYIDYSMREEVTRERGTGPASSNSLTTFLDLGRDVTSEFVELLFPIVGPVATASKESRSLE